MHVFSVTALNEKLMGKKEDSVGNKREFYRVRYPTSERPILKLEGNAYEITEIAEKGVKFLCKQPWVFKRGLEVQFNIKFRDNEMLDLEGEMLRVDGNTAIISLSEGVPLGRIVQEQRYIRAKYPDFFK
jgi:hypothetical protein